MTFLAIQVLGSVALLLWGIHMIQTGVQRTFGTRLRVLLNQALRSKSRAFVAGMVATALTQSSTATGLMLTGLAAGGLVELVPALSVMLGANVGSTLIVQIAALNISAVSPALMIFGVLLFQRSQSSLKDFGRVLIGLGLVFLAMHQFTSLFDPSNDLSSIAAIAAPLSDQPFAAILIAAIVTAILHSSVAAVLLIIAMTSHGLIPLDVALALILGANVGTAINPVIEAAHSDPASKRVPAGNLAIRASAVAACALLLPIWVPLVPNQLDSTPYVLAGFHTLFNVCVALIFLPILEKCAVVLCKLLPAKPISADPSAPRYLSKDGSPVVALGTAAREALRIADTVEQMLIEFRSALESGDRRTVSRASELDDVADKLTAAIKMHLTAIDPDSISARDRQRVEQILAFTLNMEQAADIIDTLLLNLIRKKAKRGLSFSAEGQNDLLHMVDQLIANTRAAASLFVSDDIHAARLIASQKAEFRKLEAAAVNAHFARLRTLNKESQDTSALHLDAVRDLKQINAHLVAAAAYPVLLINGELLETRVRAHMEPKVA